VVKFWKETDTRAHLGNRNVIDGTFKEARRTRSLRF